MSKTNNMPYTDKMHFTQNTYKKSSFTHQITLTKIKQKVMTNKFIGVSVIFTCHFQKLRNKSTKTVRMG
jgi:hypothetical protein